MLKHNLCSNKTKLLVDSKPQLGSKSNSTVTEHINLENSNYDFCNCINVSYTPRQILSANNFIQVRFKSVVRSHESEVASKHSNKYYRGYLIRYQFTKGNKIFLIEYFILYGRLLYGR